MLLGREGGWGVVLCGYLQEADSHQGQTVGADSPGEDLVQVPLQQELLQDEDQRRQDGVLLQHRDTHVRPEGIVHEVTGLCDRSRCRARGSNLFFLSCTAAIRFLREWHGNCLELRQKENVNLDRPFRGGVQEVGVVPLRLVLQI